MALVYSIDGVPITQNVAPSGIEITHRADGDQSFGGIPIEDPAGALTIVGHRLFTVEEDECSQPRLFTGFTMQRDMGRAAEEGLLAGADPRLIDLSVVDMNAALAFRQITGADGNRGVETWAARLDWILASDYLSEFIPNNQDWIVTNTTSMEAADYRDAYANAVLDDLVDRSGGAYTYYVFWDPGGSGGGGVRLFFDNDVETIGACDLSISNVESDVDGIDVFAPTTTSKLAREPDQTFSGVTVTYDRGTKKLYRHRPSTALAYVYRDTTISRPYTRGLATATAQAEKFLDKHEVETDRITCSIQVPAASVGLIQAGQSIQARFSHLGAPYAAAGGATMRIVSCSPKPTDDTGYWYDVALELVYRPAAGGGPCPCVEDSSGPSGLPEYANVSHNDQVWGGNYHKLIIPPVTIGAGCERDVDVVVTFTSAWTNPGNANGPNQICMAVAANQSDPPSHCDWALNVAGDLQAAGVSGTVSGTMTVFQVASLVPTLYYMSMAANAQGGATVTVDSVVIVEPDCEDDEIIDLGPTPGATTTHTVPPTVDDDKTLGYTVGGTWIDTASGKVYVLVDATDGAAVWVETTGGGTVYAPTTADYLVGTAQAGLSAEIVVGTTPGGELGGTWASPTVDATHSGSAHLALGATGSTAAAGDHTHATATGVAFLLADDHSTPFVFDDLLQNEAGDDFLYGDA